MPVGLSDLKGRRLRFRIVRNVEIDFCAAGLISMQHAERRSVDVEGDEILATDVWVTELMDVGNIRTGNGP